MKSYREWTVKARLGFWKALCVCMRQRGIKSGLSIPYLWLISAVAGWYASEIRAFGKKRWGVCLPISRISIPRSESAHCPGTVFTRFINGQEKKIPRIIEENFTHDKPVNVHGRPACLFLG